MIMLKFDESDAARLKGGMSLESNIFKTEIRIRSVNLFCPSAVSGMRGGEFDRDRGRDDGSRTAQPDGGDGSAVLCGDVGSEAAD